MDGMDDMDTMDGTVHSVHEVHAVHSGEPPQRRTWRIGTSMAMASPSWSS